MKNKNIRIKGTFLVAVFLLLGGLFLFGQAIEMNRKSSSVRVIPKSSGAIEVRSERDTCRQPHEAPQAIRSTSGTNDMLIHKSITVLIP